MDDGLVIRFEEIGIADVASVGGKNASLGEMVRALGSRGVRVPPGFATTADGFRDFLSANRLGPEMREKLSLYHSGGASLQQTGQEIRSLILDASFPERAAVAIRSAYRELGEAAGRPNPSVAVRSSATAEDLPDASFAGQQETFLNVRGERALLDACRRCYASLFTDRAIAYREAKGFNHMEVALSVGVQLMVRSDLAGSGVMFSIDTESGFPGVAVINAAWGLGETVVQGSVNPDKYMVFKPLLSRQAARPVIEKTCGAKALKMVHAEGGSRRTRIIETSRAERESFVLSDDEIIELGRWAVIVEDHYGRPMDMEWAKDGETGQLFMVQARPETVEARRSGHSFTLHQLKEKGRPILTGASVGTAIAAAPACVIRTAGDIENFRDGSILVTETTDPDWVPVMKGAAGIITNHGGTTSHAAIVSRELGVPAIVGTGRATERIVDGEEITLSCAEGDVGTVYQGLLRFETVEVDIGTIPETRTKVMVNMANPAAAFQWWRLPAKGVGLARMEFIINTLINIHPMALLHPEKLAHEEQVRIEEITRGYQRREDFFVETLARGIAKLSTPYYPHPAIVRLSDFKTNEYAHLIGGTSFEPAEENPMLGFRGASRYYDQRYRAGFELECRALSMVRKQLGFDNVIVMVPFCRTPAEADRVLQVMASCGLKRGRDGLQIYMMCEIPSNIVLAGKFAERFDGFSIGSNDLTQLMLGVDRDSDVLAELFDERDEAVKQAIHDVIGKARQAGIPIGICGQAPSNYPDFAAFLVNCGIDSISLNPDSFVKTMAAVANAERSTRTSRAQQELEPA